MIHNFTQASLGWYRLISEIKIFLGNYKLNNYKKLIENVKTNLKKLDTKVVRPSISLDRFPENICIFSQERSVYILLFW